MNWIAACSENEKNGVEVIKFSNKHFNIYERIFELEDALLKDDESIVVTGILDSEGSIKRQPAMINLDANFNESWIYQPNLNNREYFRKIGILKNDQDNLLMYYSCDSSNNSQYNIEFTEVTEDGNFIQSHRILDENAKLNIIGLTQIETSNYIAWGRDFNPNNYTSNKIRLYHFSSEGELIWSKDIKDSLNNHVSDLIHIPSEQSVIGVTENLIINESYKKQNILKFDYEGNYEVIASFFGYNTSNIFVKNPDPQASEVIFLIYTGKKEVKGNNNLQIIKTDSQGNIDWEQECGGNGSDLGEDIIQTKDNNYILLSTTSSFGNGSFDIMLSKINDKGEILWNKVYGSKHEEFGEVILEKNNGNLIVLGSTDESRQNSLLFDMLIFETDADGNPIE